MIVQSNTLVITKSLYFSCYHSLATLLICLNAPRARFRLASLCLPHHDSCYLVHPPHPAQTLLRRQNPGTVGTPSRPSLQSPADLLPRAWHISGGSSVPKPDNSTTMFRLLLTPHHGHVPSLRQGLLPPSPETTCAFGVARLPRTRHTCPPVIDLSSPGSDNTQRCTQQGRKRRRRRRQRPRCRKLRRGR